MSESDLDRLYRRTSADDPARPSASARKAILDEARQLAAQAQQKNLAAPARASRWRTLLQGVRWQIAAPVAAALLAGILLAPQWRSSLHSPTRRIVADNAPGASQPMQVAPTSANVERAPALAVPQAAPPPALAGAASEAARSADLAETESRAAAPLAAPAPRSAPAQRRQSADESSNAAESPALSQDAARALRQAAARGDLEQARVLLRTPAVAINARDADGRTALMFAVMHAQLSLVRDLLARGADPNIADARGRTPLAVARTENQRELIDMLVAAGAR